MSLIKKSFFIIILSLFILVNIISADQSKVLNVKKIILDNGFTIFLNEDHTQHEVIGMVAVKAGGKHDPSDATGIAHYLEHMLFKGTDKLGTTDYNKEKPILDKITKLYDELADTNDEESKKKIQQEINDLSLKAAEYAVPNETSQLILSIGGRELNAFTSNEKTVFYNRFPVYEMEKWLDLYSHRFINPVFRLFQSELETVYEEKNRALDNVQYQAYETAMKHFFKNHPYGQQTILGKTEHLKKPSLNKMYKFYNTYYRANNMALILSGNFDSEKIIPIIKKKFGRLKEGKIPEYPEYPEEEFKGRELLVKNITPVNAGMIAYRTVPVNHKDSPVFEIIDYLISNNNNTGFLNKLQLEGKIIYGFSYLLQHQDHGGNAVIFIPKIGTSLNKIENIIESEIDNIRKGNFDDEVLNAVKTNLKVNFYKQLENPRRRSLLIVDSFIYNNKWDDVLNYPEIIDLVTKDDIVKIANKYYSENRFVFYSKAGKQKKEKLEKPGYKPVQNSKKVKSEYAEYFEKIHTGKMKHNFVNMKKEKNVINIDENLLYYTENPVNNIFSLKIRYGTGKNKSNLIPYMASYLNDTGTKTININDFKKQMTKLGCTYNFNNNNDYFIIALQGLEDNFEESFKLLMKLLYNTGSNKNALKNIVNNKLMENITEKKEPKDIGKALKNFIIYGEESPQLNRLSLGEIKKIKPEDLINELNMVLAYSASFHYAGKKNIREIKEIIKNNYKTEKNLKSAEPVYIPRKKEYKNNTIFFINKNDALQSQVYFYIKGVKHSNENMTGLTAFNNYFGGGMSSIVFQEIREFRSLAYESYAYYTPPIYKIIKDHDEYGYLIGFIGCQSDKTITAINTMTDLIINMPEKKERIEDIKDGIIKMLPSLRPKFRNLSLEIEKWERFGLKKDIREIYLSEYENLSFDNILKFYKDNIKGKPIVICLVGNEKMIGLKKLEKDWKIIKINKNKIFK